MKKIILIAMLLSGISSNIFAQISQVQANTIVNNFIPSFNLPSNYVEYKATNATSAYLMVVPLFSGTSSQYILDTSLTTKSIDVSNYQTGQYAVVLICNGVVADYRNVLI
ncbi:MAG: hypothetical protein QM642_04890 [Edaphocola sp.]